MSNNISTDFIKINNEYVKFYATTNTALPEILKNTGALIVVQDNDRIDELNDHIRSLYIARNFVAEGHGFSAYTVRDYYDSLGAYHTTTEDKEPVRELTYILNILQNGINTNSERMNDYVLTNGGFITNTYIDAYVPNGTTTQLTSKYIINLLKPAEYNDAVITHVNSYVSYQYTSVNNVLNSYVAYATNIDELNFNDKNSVRKLQYNVPRGSKITYAYLYMESTNNDTVGFLSNNGINDSIEHQGANYSTLVLSEQIHPSDDSNIITTDTENLYEFTAYNRGTNLNNLKKYPWLPDVNFYSYENAIPYYTVSLGHINCNVYDVVKSCTMSNLVSINPNDINSVNSRIYDTDSLYSYTTISVDENNKYLYFSVPSNYETVHVLQTRKYTRNGKVSYYEYNVTGDTYEIENDQGNIINYHYKTTDNYYCECRNYCIKNKLKADDSLKLIFKKINDDNVISEYTTVPNSSTLYSISDYFLQDSEYNSTHWMSPKELSFIQNTI